MPWALFNRPSVQLGVLKSYLQKNDPALRVANLHPYLGLARLLGPDVYHEFARNVWLCEALYAGLLFPEQQAILRVHAARWLKKVKGRGQALDIDRLWRLVRDHTEEWLAQHAWQEFGLVGFSVCFSQLLASLYAARRIKERHPDLPVVFGGSSCVAEMGQSLLTTFSFIDYVVPAEGEKVLLSLCQRLSGKEDLLCGLIFTRQKGAVSGASVRRDDQILDLAALPLPEYGDYFGELGRHFGAEPFIPEIPVEFSRGCWWGKCTFCNLNLQWHGYRGKKADQVEAEVNALADRFGCLDFCFTDNVLPIRESKQFFKAMAALDRDYRFFAEIRVNQRGPVLETFRKGGLATVQAGIEGLSQSLLARMNKGATVIDNLALMKDCLEQGIILEGNLITEFPLSTQEEVEETLTNLDFVLPFTPLSTAAFFLGHGCPVDAHPRQYGITAVLSHPHNKKLFPEPVLAGLNLLIKEYRGDRAMQKRLWRPVVAKVGQWQRFHNKRHIAPHLKPPLSYRDGGTLLIIRQESADGRVLHHRLRGMSRAIYLACAEVCEFSSLQQLFPKVREEQLRKFLADLVAKRLLFSQGTRYLALAVRSRN